MLNRRELIAAVLSSPLACVVSQTETSKPIIVNLGKYHDPPLRRILPRSEDRLYFCSVPELPGYCGVVNFTRGIISICGVSAQGGETLAIPEWLTWDHIQWPS